VVSPQPEKLRAPRRRGNGKEKWRRNGSITRRKGKYVRVRNDELHSADVRRKEVQLQAFLICEIYGEEKHFIVTVIEPRSFSPWRSYYTNSPICSSSMGSTRRTMRMRKIRRKRMQSKVDAKEWPLRSKGEGNMESVKLVTRWKCKIYLLSCVDIIICTWDDVTVL
jgi:hypothetical protein